ncbi:hypothetical protein ON010_g14873 [Phytophthora cinnamomi]|nr:hypothetical protein ON010_g14873 [Phytophthora cinnamomi]
MQSGSLRPNEVGAANPEPDDDEDLDAERPATSPVDVFGLDRERFVDEQKRTPWIQAVVAFLEHGALALDPQLRTKVLQIAPHYVRDVAEYVRACTVCGSGKGYRPWMNGIMQRMPVQELSGPFSLLVVDAIGPLVTAPRGNKYILVIADYFTRWVEAFPVEALDTISFVNVMIDEVLSRHGVRERLLSDRGPNFISGLAKSFTKHWESKSSLALLTIPRRKAPSSDSTGR